MAPIAFRYISNAAGDQWTRHENELAYKRMTITPRYLTGHTDTDTRMTLLGAAIGMPVIVSVMGGHGLAHVTAEAGTAQGAHAAGTLFTAGSQSTLSMEQIAQATPGPKWFQITCRQMPAKPRSCCSARTPRAFWRWCSPSTRWAGRKHKRDGAPLFPRYPSEIFRAKRRTRGQPSSRISDGTTLFLFRKLRGCR